MVVDTDNRAVIAHFMGFTALLFCVLVWIDRAGAGAGAKRIKVGYKDWLYYKGW